MNALLIALLLVVVVLGLLALLLVALLWYVFQRPQARLEGDQGVPGLDAAVEAVRDRWGVPHLYAQTEGDAYLAQGYVHAQDRLFQMEYARRLGRGTMAQVFGAAALEADRWSRIIGFERAARQDLEALSPEEVALLENYAAGVNACMEANRLRVPAEFTILGFKPEPWTPLDSLSILKIMGWALSQNWESEVLRLQLLEVLGAERALELEPLYPQDSPSIVRPDGEVSAQAVAQVAGRVRAAYQVAGEWFGRSVQSGSNNWVIGPDRTAARRPLLANDPHLTLGIPTFWYENHLEVQDGSLRVTGASLPGVPGVMIGHNGRIAWGITAGRADSQDLFVEQRHPEQPAWFRHGESWEAAQVYREEIHVHGQPEPHVEEVVITRHGPLIDGLLKPEERAALPALALRWTGHQVSTSLRGLLCLQKAGDWQAFRSAAAQVCEPALNLVYADAAGNIGYQYVGRVPVRRSGHGLVPAPGWDDSHQWTGWVPFAELPAALNPPDGYLLSANNKPIADDYPHFLGAEWFPGYRATRIQRMLQTKPRYTVRDFQRMQTDVYSVQAEALLPFLITVDGETVLERRIVRELEAWNLRVEVDSFAAAAYEVMRIHLLDLVFADKLGRLNDYYLGMSHSDIFASSGFAGTASQCLVELMEGKDSWWFHDATGGQMRSREQLLLLALKRTAVTLHDLIGKDPRKWAWGKVHQVEFDHLLGRGRLLRTMFNRGQYPIGGDEQTVWMTAHDLKLPFGLVTTSATYRQVIDVGDWDRSTAILSTGQSGQPGSRHYADHIEMWREGDQHAMCWSREAVDREARATLWLRPAGQSSGAGQDAVDVSPQPAPSS